ncbi:MAG: UbiX family flavin prenyltransferase [Candidatus Geothermarchaeales archaeon]
MNLVVGMTGATGVVLGIRLLEVLSKHPEVQTHLVMSKWAKKMVEMEGDVSLGRVRGLAKHWYDNEDLMAPITSGTFPTGGMVIIPCSTNTLAAVANGLSNDLITRAASVTLKEGRRLVLVVRETPLSAIHLRNMLRIARAGATVLPPVLTFYYKPKTIDDIVDHIVGRVLEVFEIEHDLYPRWVGPGGSPPRDGH